MEAVRSAFYVENFENTAAFILLPDMVKIQQLSTKEMLKKFGKLVEALFRKRRSILYNVN